MPLSQHRRAGMQQPGQRIAAQAPARRGPGGEGGTLRCIGQAGPRQRQDGESGQQGNRAATTACQRRSQHEGGAKGLASRQGGLSQSV